jgi:hypothetical protein
MAVIARDSGIIVAMSDGMLLCVDCGGNPVKKWEYRLKSRLAAAPAATEKMIYAPVTGGVVALRLPVAGSASAPEQEWEYQLPAGVEIAGVAAAQGILVVAARNGAIFAFED